MILTGFNLYFWQVINLIILKLKKIDLWNKKIAVSVMANFKENDEKIKKIL